MAVRWLPVVGFERTYEVSNEGQVRRRAGAPRTPTARPRKLVPRSGYLQVVLSQDGQVTLCWVHRLVAMAFLGVPERRSQVNHLDGDRANNRASNLEWTDHRGNSLHAYRTGLRTAAPTFGEANHLSVLREDDVRAIRRGWEAGESQASLARRFDVSRNHIHRIVHRRAWAHI
ncbi:MAG: HNH endonuclease [Acidimicrobiia bacterium]